MSSDQPNEGFFNNHLPVKHIFEYPRRYRRKHHSCRTKARHKHTKTSDCICEPTRQIIGGFNKKTKKTEKFKVVYYHHFIPDPYVPERRVFPFPINYNPVNKRRSRGEDFHDDHDSALHIQDSYTTIMNTPIEFKLRTAYSLGLTAEWD